MDYFRNLWNAITGNKDLNIKNQMYTGDSKNWSELFGGSKTVGMREYPSLRGYDYETLQDRVYEGFWDFIHARSTIKQFRSLSVNTGLRLQSQPDRHILEMEKEDLQEWTIKTESLWNVWRKEKEVDYSEKNNFNQIEQIAALSYLLYSEYFAILRYSTAEKNRINPLQVQLINPRLVRQPYLGDHVKKAIKRGNKITDGIETDKRGREVAIYIYDCSQADMNKRYIRVPVKGEKTGMTFVLHGMIQDEEQQTRGIPLLSGILHELSKITDAELFELESMAANASVSGTIERDMPVVNQDKLGTMGQPGWNSSTNQVAQTAANDSPDAEAYPKVEERKIERGGYMLQNLEPGEKLKAFDTKRPNLNMTTFIDSIMEYACSTIGIGLEVVKMKFGQNYSASKGTLELTWRNLEFVNSNFSSDFNQPLYKAWMLGEIAKGRIIAPGFNIPIRRAAWTSSQWYGLPIPSLNPLNEAKAAIDRVDNGFSNREYESQKMTGTTFENNIDRLESQNKKLADANKSLVLLENTGGQEDGNE
jgi:capsid protein